MSIRARITLGGLGLVTVVICCLSGVLFGLIARGIDTDRDALLAARTDALLADVARASAEELVAGPALDRVDPRSSVDVFTMVLNADGVALQYTGAIDGQPLAIPAAVLALAETGGRTTTSIPVSGGVPDESVRATVAAWSRPDLNRRGYVVAAQTSRKADNDRNALVALFVVTTLVTFVAAAIAVWFATGRALRPLREMAALADEVGRSQDLSRRLPVPSTQDAVGRLSRSFNAMMDRLQEAYGRLAASLQAQQQFTADASHELRTPLTTIRNNAEFLLAHPQAQPGDRDAALRDLAGESVRLSRLVENLLTLARADGGLTVRREPVDLAAVAEPVYRQAAALHPAMRITLAAAPVPPVTGDSDLLTQLLWILVDNAVKFAQVAQRRRGQADGREELPIVEHTAVWLAVEQRDNRVLLSVADNGIGLPPGSEHRIFERFYRTDAARSGGGAGLGLAIAAWIAREHGGDVIAANNDRGGATFTVDLPATPWR